jgi:hypothetical protein
VTVKVKFHATKSPVSGLAGIFFAFMIQSSWPRSIPALVILVLLGCSATAQRGALTTPRSIDQLSQEAAFIVHGHVTSAKVEPHPQLHNLMTVLVTMNVEETLKGTPSKSIQFRQYIWDIRDQIDAARYGKGEDLLLMLGPVSQYGLTSPVGLQQGRFRITRSSKGEAMAVNGNGNLRLFQATEQRAEVRGVKLSQRVTAMLRQNRQGPVPLADLEDAIRTFARAK